MAPQYQLQNPEALFQHYPSMLRAVSISGVTCENCGSHDRVTRQGFFHAPQNTGQIEISPEVVELCEKCINDKAKQLRKETMYMMLVGWPIVFLLGWVYSMSSEDQILGGLFVIGVLGMIGGSTAMFKSWKAWTHVAAGNLARGIRLPHHTKYIYWDFDDEAKTIALQKITGRR